MFALFIGLAGGALFWLRGSAQFEQLTGRGKTTADAVWAGGLSFLLLPLLGWLSIPMALALWLGGRFPWWGSLSLGRDKRFGTTGSQWIRHSARGFVWVAPAAILLGWAGFVPGALALSFVGFACPIFYEIGYRIDERWEFLDPTEIGEILFGFTIAIALMG